MKKNLKEARAEIASLKAQMVAKASVDRAPIARPQDASEDPEEQLVDEIFNNPDPNVQNILRQIGNARNNQASEDG